jgi:hypothetical protein
LIIAKNGIVGYITVLDTKEREKMAPGLGKMLSEKNG